MNTAEAYKKLVEHSTETSYLGSTVAVLNWDERTYIPRKGHHHRVGQLTTLARMLHRMVTDPVIGELLDVLEGSEITEDRRSAAAVNIREWRRTYDRAVKIPERLAVDLARAAAEGQAAWEKARPANDWNSFKPYLRRIVDLKREQAEALGYDNEPYDALLDYYEQGETARNLEPIFKELSTALADLVRRIEASTRRPDKSIMSRHYPRAAQEDFATVVARQIGYDMEAGRLDVSAHPFTTGIGPGDVRITTRYDEESFGQAFFSVIHEAGHALYHQGLPLEDWGTPLCRPISLGINESQSRMWENLVARSLAFWRHFYPMAQKRFVSLRDVSLEDFHFAMNEVTPSLIRTDADEVTYNLHVLLRFELEVLLMRGELAVDDLPTAWNEKMEKLLGLTPPDFSHGVMQDVHWSSGSIGYFPTYTLGNLYAAQFFGRADEDLGDLDQILSRGQFDILLAWLRAKIHSQGSRYLPRELVETVTGEDLEPHFLIDYLNRKYGQLYRL
jgi:carboxypeptidase Taq